MRVSEREAHLSSEGVPVYHVLTSTVVRERPVEVELLQKVPGIQTLKWDYTEKCGSTLLLVLRR